MTHEWERPGETPSVRRSRWIRFGVGITWQTLINNQQSSNLKHGLRCQFSCENTFPSSINDGAWQGYGVKLLRADVKWAKQHIKRERRARIGCESVSVGSLYLLEVWEMIHLNLIHSDDPSAVVHEWNLMKTCPGHNSSKIKKKWYFACIKLSF